MPDVLKIAIERREVLLKEISALDRFIVTAHDLLAQAARREHARKPKSDVSSSPPAAKTVEKPEPAPIEPASEEAPTGPSATPPEQPLSKTEAFLRKIGVGSAPGTSSVTVSTSRSAPSRPVEGLS